VAQASLAASLESDGLLASMGYEGEGLRTLVFVLGESSLDESVLPALEAALADPAPLKFILVHLLGGHPAYDFRYPESFDVYDGLNDEVAARLEGAGRAFWAIEARNDYDNAMLYGDHVLRSTLDLCRSRRDEAIVWLFAPDHGENVAHYDNFAGHNTRVMAMYEIPMLFWRSPDFPSPAVDTARLELRPFQTDAMDQALLGLMGARGGYYRAEADLFSAAYRPLQRFVNNRAFPLRP